MGDLPPREFFSPRHHPVCLLAEGLAGAEGVEGPPAVLVAGGRIQALGRAALEAPARRLPLPGLWLTPAPLDAHVHLRLGGAPEANLTSALSAGVAAVRDLGHQPGLATPRGNRQHPPWVVNSGPGLGAAGEGGCWLAQPLAGPGAMAQAAWERARAGAGVVKLFVSGLLDFDRVGGVLHHLALSPDEIAAATQAAQEAGLPVAAHANGPAAVEACLTAGVDSIEHGFFMGPELLERMARQGTAWIPTCAAVAAHALDPEGRHDQTVRDNLRRILAGQLEAVRRAEALGVNLVLGTDAGSYGLEHGAAVFREMALWLEAGVKPATVFRAATSRAARLLGLGQELGEIKPGARPWLLGVPGDPRANPLLLAEPRWRSF
ncbi:MAG: amidohydrolase family protein [Desulfarculus sp.]|nr:amidohydrolase family protein [Desulfarculus sp.]